MSTYDSNLDDLEKLLQDLDGRPNSVAPPSARKDKGSTMNFNELDDIISVLGSESQSNHVPYQQQHRQSQAPQHNQQQYSPQPQQQQHYQPQQHQQQPNHMSYNQLNSSSNRNTMDNIDELLRGLESNRSSVRASVAPPRQSIRPQQPPQQYQQPQQQQYQQPQQQQYQQQPYQQQYNQMPAQNQPNKRMTYQAPVNPASQQVLSAKPISNRPIAGDDLGQLLDTLTKSQPTTNNPVPKGSCSGCGKHIIGESISALGQIWHPDHFACGNCRQKIGTGSFFEQDGVPHCERCYQELLCSRCAHCEEPILDKCVTALGKKWHMNHFICTQCLSPFGTGRYFERDSRPYCESCFSGNFAPRCGGCDQPIKGECTNALGRSWHPEHFVCQYCQKAFTSSFFEFAGKPYCDVHYHQQTGSLCAGCSKAITGKCVNALDKKWHPEHFICAFCMSPLQGGNFTENANKAYCRDCHGKLFG